MATEHLIEGPGGRKFQLRQSPETGKVEFRDLPSANDTGNGNGKARDLCDELQRAQYKLFAMAALFHEPNFQERTLDFEEQEGIHYILKDIAKALYEPWLHLSDQSEKPEGGGAS